MKRLSAIFFSTVFLAFFTLNSAFAGDDFVPDKPLETVAGETVNLTKLKGKVLVVNFWATWCPPCLDEIPELVRFQDEFARRGVQVIGIDFMEQPNRERLQTFIKKHEMNYPVVFGKPSEMQVVARAMGGVFGLPVTKVVDRTGKVL